MFCNFWEQQSFYILVQEYLIKTFIAKRDKSDKLLENYSINSSIDQGLLPPSLSVKS